MLNPSAISMGTTYRLRIKTLINQAGKLSVDARVVGVKRIGKTVAVAKVTFPRTLVWAAGLAIVGLIAMLVGEASGLLVPNGHAELRLVKAGALVIIFLLLDEVKTNILELRGYYREKKDTPK